MNVRGYDHSVARFESFVDEVKKLPMEGSNCRTQVQEINNIVLLLFWCNVLVSSLSSSILIQYRQCAESCRRSQ